MVRRPCRFTETDLKRALKAAKAAGVPVKIDIENGKMTVTIIDKPATIEMNSSNAWDIELE
jgi:hypothetical protein